MGNTRTGFNNLCMQCCLVQGKGQELKSCCTLVEAAPVSIFIVIEESIRYANPASARMLGYSTPEEMVGLSVFDCIAEESRQLAVSRLDNLIDGRENSPVEMVVLQKSGEAIIVESTSVAIVIDNQPAVVIFAQDISKRIEREKQLLKFRYITESIQNPIAMVGEDYRFRYVNGAYAEMFSKSVEEFIGISVAELIGREIFEAEIKPHYDACLTGDPAIFRMWYEFPRIGRRLLDVRYYPYRGSGQRGSAVISSIHDITEIKELELRYKESEARFHGFMDNIPEGIYIKDEDDRHLYINPYGAEVMGKSAAEIVGATTADLFPSETAAVLSELDRKVLTENISSISEEWQISKSGKVQWIRDIKFPIHLQSGAKLLGGIAIDTTKIREKEHQLEEALKEITALKESLETENISLLEELGQSAAAEQVVGNSDALKRCLVLAEKVAAEQTTVLLQGETGTGKELIANCIHKNSSRKIRPMIKVNCAALPANLIESELFGREKGAFTGAMARQEGRFKIADGSTIFLDEIGDLPIELQSKLLRVLQEGSFERLGSSQTTTVDVRVIAATNHDLKAALREGRFRKDLYYRLNIFPITVPPLRERVEDIPQLTWAFVSQFNSSMGKSVLNISEKDMDLLKSYPWPGNVRELKNIIERSMIMCSGHDLKIGKIDTDDFEETSPSTGKTLADVERGHILKVLEKCGWRVSGTMGAAEVLGLKPTTLEARMKKLDIRRPA